MGHRESLFTFCYNALFLEVDVWHMVVNSDATETLFPPPISGIHKVCPMESNVNSFNLRSVWQKLFIYILTYLIFLKTEHSRVD